MNLVLQNCHKVPNTIHHRITEFSISKSDKHSPERLTIQLPQSFPNNYYFIKQIEVLTKIENRIM